MSAKTKVVDPTKPTGTQDVGQVSPLRLIHFLSDGFTAFGNVWYRGQELEIDEEHYKETLNKSGESWLDMPKAEQMKRFGVEMFAEGEWPFEAYEDSDAQAAEIRRGRRPRE